MVHLRGATLRTLRRMTSFVRPGTSAAARLKETARQEPLPLPKAVQRPCQGKDASPTRCANCHVFPCNKIMTRRFQQQDYSFKASRHRPWLWFFATAGVYVALNTEQVPITDRLRVRVVPEFIERRMDADYNQTIVNALTTKALPVESKEHKQIQEIGDRLCKTNGLPPMEYFVIDDEEENAFVSSGGKVIFYTGLLRVLESEDEIAVVLSHELGHFVARHGSERTGADWIKAALQLALDLDDSDTAKKVSTMALTLPKSRRVEREADHIGLILLARACYDIDAAPQAWEKLHASKLRHLQQQQQEFSDTQQQRREGQEQQREEATATTMDVHTDTAVASRVATASNALAHAQAFLEDSIEAETFAERLWATHPTHEERLEHFRINGPWMEAARAERARYCECCEALRPVPAFHETRPMRWWMRMTQQKVATNSEGQHLHHQQQQGEPSR